MSKATIGAHVKFCNHAGWFTADIYKIGNVNVVRANGPVTTDNIVRDDQEAITHELRDFPVSGFWRPDLGVFVVPESQVIRVRNAPGTFRNKPALHDPGSERFDVGHLNDVRFGDS